MSGQILVVDGTATNRITLKVRLATACYDPLTARSAAEALGMLGRADPAMVLIGGQPGDMSAADLCRQIAALRPGLPVMMMVPRQDRIAALQAGAAAVMDPPISDLDLFARIRGLLRDQHDASAIKAPGLAEERAAFDHGRAAPAASVLLVAGDAARAVGWRQALAARLPARLRIADAEQALAEAAEGLVPDLYLIAGDIAQAGDGLRLLSELRSRALSRNAAFAVVLAAGRQDMMSMALDLGAGDVLPETLVTPPMVDETALRLSALIRRKRSADQRREAEEHERWLARIDPLTGLVNRRFAIPRLAELCAAGEPCAVAAMDIDYFKRVNDCHGHAAGDSVLVSVAERLESIVGSRGFVARLGGEEFLAVLPGSALAEAETLVRRMRCAVSECPVPLPGAGRPLKITISAGLADRPADQPGCGAERAAELIGRADDALLIAKRTGRDRLIVTQPGRSVGASRPRSQPALPEAAAARLVGAPACRVTQGGLAAPAGRIGAAQIRSFHSPL